MKLNTLTLAAAAIGLCFASCSDNDSKIDVPVDPIDNGAPASFKLTINEPVSRADQEGNSLETESRFVTADIFIYSENTLVKHVRLDKDDFSLSGDHVYSTDKPIVTTTGLKEIYVGLNMPQALGAAMAAIPNKTALFLLSNTDTYNLANTSASAGFVMFSIEPAFETLVAGANNSVTAKVGRLVAKVTVEKGGSLSLSIPGGELDNLDFAIRNSNKLFWPYQKKEGNVVYDPNYYASEWKATDFNQGTDYAAVDDYDTPVLDRKVKYTPENTNEKTLRRETTYASVRAEFMPEYFTDDQGKLTASDKSGPVSFWVVKMDDTGEAYYFDNEPDAITFATDKGTVSDEYKDGYCYYNLFLNPNGNFQTLRNNFYQLRITSITGLGNPNPEDEGDDEKPVTRPANIFVDVDIQPWTVIPDEYELY